MEIAKPVQYYSANDIMKQNGSLKARYELINLQSDLLALRMNKRDMMTFRLLQLKMMISGFRPTPMMKDDMKTEPTRQLITQQ